MTGSPHPQGRVGEFDLLHYVGLAWKHKVVVLAALLLALAAGAAATFLTTPTYTARMTIQVDREAAKVINLQDITPQEQSGNGDRFYQTQYGLLKSRSLAEKVVDDLELERSPAFLRAVGLDHAPLSGAGEGGRLGAPRRQVVDAVQGGFEISPVRGSRLIAISFTSRDPQVSAQVANSFAESFIAANLERRFESSSYAREFLETRIAQAKQKLEESERQLVAYAASQEIISLQDGDAGSDQSRSLAGVNLAALNSELATTRAERIRAEQKWRQAQATSGLGMAEMLQSPAIQQLSKIRAEQVTEYQEMLKVYKPDFPAMVQLKAQLDETDRQISAEAANIRNSLQAHYQVALNQERALAAQVEDLKGSVLDLRDRSVDYNILQREVDTNRTLYDGLLQRYKEIGVTGGVTANNISIVDRAEPPTSPSAPRPLVNMALALVLGLAVGLGGALLLEALDQAIRHPSDVETKLGLPLLGAIPILARGVTAAEAMRDPRSAFWEAYYSVRTALQFSTPQGVPRSVLVTSARPSEGKSTTALALAQSLARLGIRTLLVDADLRRPTVHTALGADAGVGLSNYLTSAVSLYDIVQPTHLPSLGVVASGPIPPSPAELLAGNRFRSFLAEAEQEFEVVVIDGPPVMGLADAPMIASLVKCAILAVEAGRTGRSPVLGAIRRLRMARAVLAGVVLTKFDERKTAYGYGASYDYQYSYSSERAVAVRGG